MPRPPRSSSTSRQDSSTPPCRKPSPPARRNFIRSTNRSVIERRRLERAVLRPRAKNAPGTNGFVSSAFFAGQVGQTDPRDCTSDLAAAHPLHEAGDRQAKAQERQRGRLRSLRWRLAEVRRRHVGRGNVVFQAAVNLAVAAGSEVAGGVVAEIRQGREVAETG